MVFPELLQLMETNFKERMWRLSCERYGELQSLYSLSVDGVTVAQAVMNSVLKDNDTVLIQTLVDRMIVKLEAWESSQTPVGIPENRSTEHEVFP